MFFVFNRAQMWGKRRAQIIVYVNLLTLECSDWYLNKYQQYYEYLIIFIIIFIVFFFFTFIPTATYVVLLRGCVSDGECKMHKISPKGFLLAKEKRWIFNLLITSKFGIHLCRQWLLCVCVCMHICSFGRKEMSC